MKFSYNFSLLFASGFCLFLYLKPSTDGMPTTGGKNGQPNSSSSSTADFQMSPKNHGTTTVRHRKPNNEQRKSDGPTLKRTMSALGVAALALSAGQSVEAGRPLGTTMEQTLAPPPKPMQMSREANSPLLCDCETNPPPAVPIYSPPPPPPPMFSPPPPPPPATVGCPPPPPPATEGALAPPPPATEGALAPPPPGGLVITGYPDEDKQQTTFDHEVPPICKTTILFTLSPLHINVVKP
ncbi:hypothetical protein niasHS_015728 [Heterodera schachtii]|uniref:Uncharacterized protein n=1 Tax=Heterodera schachtii TaxID=97005 RepID=A0ABD2IDZ2_HETSC